MASTIILLQDAREKTPLTFPSTINILTSSNPYRVVPHFVHVVKKTLITGDYAIQGAEDACLVERKGSLQEVAMNCTDDRDRPRFIRSLERLSSSCRHPVLLFEGDMKAVLKPTPRLPNPGPALDALFRLLLDYRISFHTYRPTSMADRRTCGELVVRLLFAGANSCLSSSVKSNSSPECAMMSLAGLPS